MRRISTGVQGRPILGNFFTETNTFSTRETNQDIVLEPNGSGVISAESHLRIDGSHALIFRDSDNNNTITIESPAISSDYTLTLPTGVGTAGDVLTVDGSGNLSFSGINVNINNQTADTATYYPLLSTSTSGDVGDLSVSSSKLSFQPSSGTLTAESYVETSTIRLKENIKPINDALEDIKKLQGVTYDRKTGDKLSEAGLIAEDVYKVLPNLVSKDDEGNPYGINYTKFTAYLIECVKTLSSELEILKGSRSNNG